MNLSRALKPLTSRLSKIHWLVMIVLLLVLGSFAANMIFRYHQEELFFIPPCNPGDLGGQVWSDNNFNGIRTAGEVGVPGVEVRLYDDGGLVGSTTTDTVGKYSFGVLTNYPYRIEVITNLDKTKFGTNNNTTVQFVTAPTCTADVGLRTIGACDTAGLNIFVPCFILGAASSPGTRQALVRFRYITTQGTDGDGTLTPNSSARPVPFTVADYSETGTTYGLAFDRSKQILYSGAFLRTRTPYKDFATAAGDTAAPGQIFRITSPNGASPVVSDYVNLNTIFGAGTAGKNTHPNPLVNNALCSNFWNHDTISRPFVSKTSLGDLEMSANDSILYVVNMHDKQLYAIPTTGPLNSGTIQRWPIPTSGSGDVGSISKPAIGPLSVDVRPMALGVNPYNGKLYVGATYSAQTSQLASELRAYVWEFDGAGGFTMVLNESLNYPRKNDPFHPWTDVDTFGNYRIGAPFNDGGGFHAEPLLSDIAFDGMNMILGLRDRYADKTPGACKFANDPPYPRSHGDILRACYSGGIYTLESGGSCGGVTTAGSVRSHGPSGPGGGEFYYGDDYSGDGDDYIGPNGASSPDTVGESTQGALLVLPGQNHVISTAFDAVNETSAGAERDDNYNTGGVVRYNNTTGFYTGAYDVYLSGDDATLDKANGLGDIEAGCGLPLIQIGNYVWEDTDLDGIQDPGEDSIPGVIVSLFSSSGTFIKSTTTNTIGQYYFDSLRTDSSYAIVFGRGQMVAGAQYTPATDILLVGGKSYKLTVSNTGTGVAPDLNDSDPYDTSVVGVQPWVGYPVIFYRSGQQSDHSLDAGFYLPNQDIVDVAMRKTIADTLGNAVLEYGDTIKFAIKIFNQGTVPIDSLVINDSVPNGYTFVTPSGAINQGWVLSGSEANYTWGRTPMDTLESGDSAIVCIWLQVNSVAAGMSADYTNRAEISKAYGLGGVDVSSQDIDSPLNDNYGDNGGGNPGSPADDAVTGNGTGAPGTSVPGTDQDNADPAQLNIVDVALRKTVADTLGNAVLEYGDTIKFAIKVFNQGSVPIDSLLINDTIPNGYTFVTPSGAINQGWVFSGNEANYTWGRTPMDTLLSGDSATVCIWLRLTSVAAGMKADYTNRAEISKAY